MSWTSLCELADLTENVGKHVDIDGFQLAVFLSAGQVYVMDNTCPHAGAPMAAGWVDRGCAVCPRHAWSFHLDTGELAGSPGVKIRTYPARLRERPDGQPTLVQADLPIF
jgi:nitrite reductase/ring-hydroxylating ferredoxin subunit